MNDLRLFLKDYKNQNLILSIVEYECSYWNKKIKNYKIYSNNLFIIVYDNYDIGIFEL